MGMIGRTCIFPGLLIVIGTFVTARGQDDTLPKRTTFTFPPQMEGLAKGLEEAGVQIIYGPNSVPAPEGISEAAKKVWVNLPQLPYRQMIQKNSLQCER